MPQHYEDVQRALEGISGVASASVVGGDGGRGRLRIRLAPGYDSRDVARAASELLRRRFGIDVRPSDIRPSEHVEVDDVGTRSNPGPEDAPVRPSAATPDASVENNGGAAADASHGSNGRRPGRPAIRELETSVDGLEVTAVTVLDLDGTEVTGRATGAATGEASLRAIARATLAAVDHLVPGRAKTDLEQVSVEGQGASWRVSVTVVYLTPEGEERLAGVALVRDDDVDGAVVRAALDAVNRRIGAALRERASEPAPGG